MSLSVLAHVLWCSCLPLQSDRPVVCAVTTEAERSLPHHHRGRPPAAGSGCKTPQLQGGAASCIASLTPIALLCTLWDTLTDGHRLLKKNYTWDRNRRSNKWWHAKDPQDRPFTHRRSRPVLRIQLSRNSLTSLVLIWPDVDVYV